MNQMDSASRTKRRRPRRAASLDDRDAMRVTKATHEPPVEPEEKSTGGLANMTGSGTPGEGGKLYPAQGPGFRGLLDDEKARQPNGTPTHTNKRKPKQKATVSHDTIAKLVDVSAYDASVQSNAALRDDFNVVMAWFGEWKKRPSGYKYGRRKLGFLMRKILKEAVKRGPEVMRFNTSKLEPDQREFFLEVAGQVGVPKTMMRKSMDDIDLVNLDVSRFKLDKLHRLHDISHLLHEEAKNMGRRMDCAKLVGLHALVVSEMMARGTEHPLPPRDGLDRTSRDFEVVNLNKFLEDSNPNGFAHVDKSEAHAVFKLAAGELWDTCKGCSCGKSADGVKQCKGGPNQRADGYAPPGSQPAKRKGVDGFPERDSEPEPKVLEEMRRKTVGKPTAVPIDNEGPVPDPGTKPKHPPERPPGGATVPPSALNQN